MPPTEGRIHHGSGQSDGLFWGREDGETLSAIPWPEVVARLQRRWKEGKSAPASYWSETLLQYLLSLGQGAPGRPLGSAGAEAMGAGVLALCRMMPELVATLAEFQIPSTAVVRVMKRVAIDWLGEASDWPEEAGQAGGRARQALAAALAEGQTGTAVLVAVEPWAGGSSEGLRQVITRLAERWQPLLAPEDGCWPDPQGRLFVLLAGPRTMQELRRQLRRMQWLGRRLLLDGQWVRPTLRFGHAAFPQAGRSAEEIWAAAEAGLHPVSVLRKASGDQRTGHWTERLLAPGGLANVRAFFQPIIHLPTGQVQGFEALARYVEEDGTVHFPQEFMPVLQRHGRIRELDRVVLEQAMAALAEWRQRGWPGYVAVNVAPEDLFSGEWFQALEVLLRRYPGLTPAALHLEIVESAALTDVGRARELMRQIARLGYRWSLDDFGTGFSSLAHMHLFPIHTVKVDRSFLGDWDSPTARAIIQAIIGMARPLGVAVVAEGVEREAQVQALREWGCHAAQGFWFGRAMAPERVWSWLEEATLRGGRGALADPPS
ncbi:MAG: EAL domain-containing protein [Firmicutes bacterium]|nr:EAL domain-containing protein [Bacillota bacterium]